MSTVKNQLDRGDRTSSNRVVSGITLGSMGVLVAFTILWQISSTLTFVIPGVGATLGALGKGLIDPEYLRHLWATVVSVTSAFILGVVAGALIGLGLGLSRIARDLFEPMVLGLNGIPKIVLYPLILPVFQLGFGSKVVMGVLFCVFPVLINVAAGVSDIPKVYWKLAKTVKASRVNTLVHIVIPFIRRPLLTGIRLAVSLAAVGVVLSEFFASKAGLGRVVLQAYSAGDYASMMATILLLVTISFVLSIILWNVEKRVVG